MFTSTTDYIPDRKYEIIGTVTGTRFMSMLSSTEVTKAIAKLIDEAKEMGADGVIGIKPYTTANRSTGVIGTAIKFIK